MSEICPETVREALNLDELEKTLRTSMVGWPGLDARGIEDVVSFVRSQAAEFIRHVDIVEDPAELATSAARAYMSWMNTWYAINVQNNYALMKGEACDPRDQWKGMAMSQLASAIGSLLPQEQLENIHEFVTLPPTSNAA